MKHVCKISVVACLLSMVVLAQTTSTEILGTVTDPSGAVIQGAKVTLIRPGTGERRTVVTGPTGDYSFPLIDIGEYTVAVEAPGFKRFEKKGIVVQLQQKARVDIEMQVGATTETVEVTAKAITLKTEDQTVGQVVDNKRVVELPLNGRNVAALAVLVPGVQFGVRMGVDGAGGFPIPGNGVAISANGQREVNQSVTLDGIIATEPRVNTAAFSPSIDALEEFKVMTSSYSAEYGQNSGAIIQMVVKGGTNQFRGTFWEFLRNDKLAAKDYFLNFQLPAGTRLADKNRLRRNQFGTFLSGPVRLPGYNGRDRTFWSFNYEGRRETREASNEAFFIPEPFRRGDFSGLLTHAGRRIIIYDPLTGEPFRDSSGRITNIIPANRINRSAQEFINKYSPLPQFTPANLFDVNYLALVPNIIEQNQFMFRIDQQFTAKDKVFFRYIVDKGDWTQGYINPNFNYFVTATNWNLGAQWVRIISPRVLNELRYGVNKADDNTLNPRSNTDFDVDSLGLGQFRVATDNNRKFTNRETGIPPIGVPGLVGDRDGGNGYDFNTVHQVSDNLSFTFGSHNFKTGIESRRNLLDRAAANLPRGSTNFGDLEAGYSVASFLLGYPNNTTTGEGFPYTAPRQNRWAAYFLDDWKASRKLTLNVGVRMDLFQIPLDSFGAWRSLRLDVLTRATDGRMLPTVIPEPGTKNWPPYSSEGGIYMPRIGLAYRATDKWVIRAGFGIFANAQQLNNYTILNLQPPTSGTVGFNATSVSAGTVSFEGISQETRRLTGTILTLANSFPGATTLTGRRNVLLVPPDNKSMSHAQWSIDIQRQLPWNTVLTLAYVGSKSTHVDTTVNWNNPDPSTSTDINARRPYQWHVSQGEGLDARALGNIRYLDSYANANYHGLQTTFEKRYSNGLIFGLAYTYSKSQGEGYGRNEGQLGVSNVYQNPRDRRSSRSRYGFDVTHNAVINFVYEMPFLNRFKSVAGAIIGGWQMNGILTFRGGFPFTPNGGTLNTGGPSTPDRIADGRLFDRATRQLWFDPNAFTRNDCNIAARPDLCHYGNAGFGILTTPGAKVVDYSIYKNWRLPMLGEAGRLQFRAEFFNFFNTPQFGQPNNTAWSGTAAGPPNAPRVGEIRGLRLPMRIIQFGAKINF